MRVERCAVHTALVRFRNPLATRTGPGGSTAGLGWFMALFSSFAFSIATPIAKGAIDAGLDPATLLTLRLILLMVLLGLSIGLIAPGYLRLDRRGLLVCGVAGLSNGIGMLAIQRLNWALWRPRSRL